MRDVDPLDLVETIREGLLGARVEGKRQPRYDRALNPAVA